MFVVTCSFVVFLPQPFPLYFGFPRFFSVYFDYNVFGLNRKRFEYFRMSIMSCVRERLFYCLLFFIDFILCEIFKIKFNYCVNLDQICSNNVYSLCTKTHTKNSGGKTPIIYFFL